MPDDVGDASSAVVDTLIDTRTLVLYLANSIRSISWARHASRILRLLALPLSLITIPLSLLADVVLVVLAPLIYLTRLVLAIIQGLVSLLISLKPLYSFLSAAAGIGILAGLFLGISSSLLTSYLGLHDTDTDTDTYTYTDDNNYHDSSSSQHDSDNEKLLEKYLHHGQDDYSLDVTFKKYLQFGRTRDGSIEPVANRRPTPPGLLSQTIHEEDDSSAA